MIRNKFTVDFRNKLAELAMSVDSCAAIEGSRMTSCERSHIQDELRALISYIDSRIS